MAKHSRFPGSNEPLHIFQDDLFDSVITSSVPMTSHAPMPTVSKPSRRPLGSSSSNVVLNPPNANPRRGNLSPHKTRSSSPRSPVKSPVNKLHAVSMAPPPLGNRQVTDSLQKRPFLSKFKTGPQKPSVDLGMHFGKENVHPHIFPAPQPINLSVEDYYPKPNGKRGLLDAAPINAGFRPNKKIKTEDQALPPWDSFPPIHDDGAKPQHSYAQLIGMAILRSPNRRLTLAQIYKWISDNFSFYNPNDAGWQNSIRHNLSLHKNFIKIERPKDDPGKGNYWGIETGTEHQFLKEKPSRKSAPSAENLPVMSTRLEPSRLTPAPPPPEPSLPPLGLMPQIPLPQLPQAHPTTQELSSDATIPVSDGSVPEEVGDKVVENEAALENSLYSPGLGLLNSSPLARSSQLRSGTPPPPGSHQNSASRSRKRSKFASMDDSGYISSLESSALRPTERSFLMTSEADKPRRKKQRLGGSGRAEDEIARLRNSSPHSPTKRRSKSAFGPISSSPLRHAQDNQMLPPLTPLVKIKAPEQPVSVSPATNLAQHRDRMRTLLQSPLRRVTEIGDEVGGIGVNTPCRWSPAFKLEDSLYNFDDFNVDTLGDFGDFNTFNDNTFGFTSNVSGNGSPLKRSAKRKPLERAATTSVLGSLTGSAAKKPITSAPFLKVPDTPMQFLETPSKAFEGMSSPSKFFQQSPCKGASPSKFDAMLEMVGDNDWPHLMLDNSQFMPAPSSNPMSDFTGLDILQGFEKIGSGNGNGSQAAKSKGNKPGLGRSFSTTF
ncbi:unnamed protein product, partial [Clonostachys rosea f. rosea IK726]|uniref:Fork-head domain-containing protein n=2 Tax=Bionectria ochroleuca TaxID=29856 RepID=A0A0B7JRN0_BIOOC